MIIDSALMKILVIMVIEISVVVGWTKATSKTILWQKIEDYSF